MYSRTLVSMLSALQLVESRHKEIASFLALERPSCHNCYSGLVFLCLFVRFRNFRDLSGNYRMTAGLIGPFIVTAI